MRIANRAGRLVLVADGRCTDVARASNGRFGPGPHSAYDQWDELRSWAATAAPDPDAPAFDERDLLAPAPEPRQVFGTMRHRLVAHK